MGRGEGKAMKIYWINKFIKVYDSNTQCVYVDARTNSMIMVQGKLF